jgi:hypothetical protein
VGGELVSDDGVIVSQDMANVSQELRVRMARLDAQRREAI